MLITMKKFFVLGIPALLLLGACCGNVPSKPDIQPRPHYNYEAIVGQTLTWDSPESRVKFCRH